jgi:hypothetical protein
MCVELKCLTIEYNKNNHLKNNGNYVNRVMINFSQ